jgi:FkbH-like protein
MSANEPVAGNARNSRDLSSPAKALELYWLPPSADFSSKIKLIDTLTDPSRAWAELNALAESRLDFIRTNRLDASLCRHFRQAPPPGIATRPVKLAMLSSSTVGHLVPAMRIGALRRGIWMSVHEGEFGQYQQEMLDSTTALHDFKPDVVLFAFDTPHLLRGFAVGGSSVEAERVLAQSLGHLRECWRRARDAFGCQVIQQSFVPVYPALLGNNEHRLPGSRAALVASLNYALRDAADKANVDVLAIDNRVAIDGLERWHDPVLWHRAKQEISPSAAPVYADLVGRLIAANQGRSRKCLVLDLDNTLWGGVVGDVGVEGLKLGQGSALGEAFVAVQEYARDLSRRGVILAVCSKNDHENAVAPFDQHPDMVLKRADIACFIANWQNKADNLRAISARLNIGLESLVFLDDNPFERNLVRAELPMVAVPEVSADPATYPACIADGGYFEGLSVTDEDLSRTSQYKANEERELLASESADLSTYLSQLNMQLIVRRFDRIGLQRIVQLINKTNQFNLTTRRYTDDEVSHVMGDERSLGLQFRLVDRYGDNGIIAIVIVRMTVDNDALIDTWLMSCRVLGRGVETATLDVVVEAARRLGARRLLGEFRPTAKNGMVRDHYKKLGFQVLGEEADSPQKSCLDLDTYSTAPTHITIEERNEL